MCNFRNCTDEKRVGILSEPLVEVEERENEAVVQPQQEQTTDLRAKSKSRVSEHIIFSGIRREVRIVSYLHCLNVVWPKVIKFRQLPPNIWKLQYLFSLGAIPNHKDGRSGRQARLARLWHASGHARAPQGARGDQEVNIKTRNWFLFMARNLKYFLLKSQTGRGDEAAAELWGGLESGAVHRAVRQCRGGRRSQGNIERRHMYQRILQSSLFFKKLDYELPS